MKPMYPAKVNSPVTELASDITASQTSISLINGSALADAPNRATIGQGENAETVIYTVKSGNTISGITRGAEGAARTWLTGTKVARNFTAGDHNTLIENLLDIESKIADKTQIIVTENPPAISDRPLGTFYFHVTDSIPVPTDTEHLRVSPNMGIKIKE